MANKLGIDQSYTSCGYCIKDENGVMLTFGVLRSPKAMDVYDRAAYVANFVSSLVSAHNVSEVNIEGLAFGIRGDATRDLAGLLFTIVTTIRRNNKDISINVIAPTSLKKFATGTGKSDKASMIEAVPKTDLDKFTDANYKKTTGLTDLCDAYWLASYKKS